MTMDPNPGGAQGGAPPPPPEPPNGALPPEPQRPYVRADQLPEDALKARLDQAKRVAAQEARAAAFKELGIEDPDKFKSDREKTDAELKRYKDAEEKRKRAEMTEAQRYKADVDRLTAENEALRRQLSDVEEQQVYSRQEQICEGIAARYVRPRLVRAARAEFAMNMNELAKADPKAVDEYTDKDVERWFRKLAADPDWAIPKAPEVPAAATPAAAAKPPEAPKPPERRVEPVRRPAGSPPPRQGSPRPVSGASGEAEKTFKPNQKNSMSRAEVAAALRAKGMRPY